MNTPIDPDRAVVARVLDEDLPQETPAAVEEMAPEDPALIDLGEQCVETVLRLGAGDRVGGGGHRHSIPKKVIALAPLA